MKKILIIAILFLLTFVNVYAEGVHKVTFISDDNTSVVEVNENEKVTPPEFIKEGYTLIGWSNNGVVFDFTTPITSDITLNAIWRENKIIEQEVEEEPEINKKRDRGYSDLSDEMKYLIIGIPVVIVILIKYILVPVIKNKKENMN